MFTAEWTGSFPCLCHGTWKLFKNGADVSSSIPFVFGNRPMGTKGTYKEWYSNQWHTYENGLPCEEWIAANPWISAMCANHDEMVDLFLAFQSSDWRHGQCGGCI